MASALLSCSDEKTTPEEPEPVVTYSEEDLIVCDEGNWQSDNGRLSYYSASTRTINNNWFADVTGHKLGDTPNDIIQVNDTLIAIAVNWSNIIQYIRPDGTDAGSTEDVPNNRRMCIDGEGYLYITSYAHQCGSQTFTKGYVAKIDVATKQVVATCEVGWEPEGVRYYGGKLYVANTGGYAYSESHTYETTLQVVDAATMQSLKTIDLGCINLYGEMSQAGQYLCINSCGDYYDTAASTVIFDCATEDFKVYDFPSTYNTTDGTLFYTVGSAFSYNTYEYQYYIHTIDPRQALNNSNYVMGDTIYSSSITEKIKGLTAPYEIYVSPYTGNFYFTDAMSYASAGYLYGYDKQGNAVMDKQKVYINPAHILAINPK